MVILPHFIFHHFWKEGWLLSCKPWVLVKCCKKDYWLSMKQPLLFLMEKHVCRAQDNLAKCRELFLTIRLLFVSWALWGLHHQWGHDLHRPHTIANLPFLDFFWKIKFFFWKMFFLPYLKLIELVQWEVTGEADGLSHHIGDFFLR